MHDSFKANIKINALFDIVPVYSYTDRKQIKM